MAPTYPPTLTNKAWQKNKGLFAKSKSTGIGETLTALEKAFMASHFVKLDPAKLAAETLDPLTYSKRREALIKALGQQGAKLDPLVKQSEASASAATKEFAKNGSVLKVLNGLIKELVGFRGELAPNGGLAKQFVDDMDSAFKKRFAQTKTAGYIKGGVAKNTETSWRAVPSMIKKVEAQPSAQTIHATWGTDGPHRVLTTSCKMWDQLFVADCPDLTHALLPGKTIDDFGHLPWMWEVANETNGDASSAVSRLAAGGDEARAATKMALEYSRSLLEYKRFVDALNRLAREVGKWA